MLKDYVLAACLVVAGLGCDKKQGGGSSTADSGPKPTSKQGPTTQTLESIQRPMLGKTLVETQPDVQAVASRISIRSTGVTFTAYKVPFDLPATRDATNGYTTWQNHFIYTDVQGSYFTFRQLTESWGVADGARTHDRRSKAVVAEARLVVPQGPPYKGLDDLEVEEFHYGASGEVTFYCRSRFSQGSGVKTSESGHLGTKSTEYYPCWAVR